MNIQKAIKLLNDRAGTSFDLHQRKPGKYQLIIPILHEDGDMIDIYLQDSPEGKGHIRVCDFGMTIMRLSYIYEINTDSRRRIFDSILINNGIQNDDANLYIDTTYDMLYERIMQFASCVQKLCNMRYWSREVIRSSFYEDLKEYAVTGLKKFDPRPNFVPLPDYEIITVDWSLRCNNCIFYLFGVRGTSKAHHTAIALLEFKKAKLPFLSLVVHEDIEELGKKESTYLTKNADKQYPTLPDLKEDVISDIERYAGLTDARLS